MRARQIAFKNTAHMCVGYSFPPPPIMWVRQQWVCPLFSHMCFPSYKVQIGIMFVLVNINKDVLIEISVYSVGTKLCMLRQYRGPLVAVLYSLCFFVVVAA